MRRVHGPDANVCHDISPSTIKCIHERAESRKDNTCSVEFVRILLLLLFICPWACSSSIPYRSCSTCYHCRSGSSRNRSCWSLSRKQKMQSETSDRPKTEQGRPDKQSIPCAHPPNTVKHSQSTRDSQWYELEELLVPPGLEYEFPWLFFGMVVRVRLFFWFQTNYGGAWIFLSFLI